MYKTQIWNFLFCDFSHLHTAIIQMLQDYAMNIISWTPCPSLLNITNNFLQTPLHLAAITRQPDLVRKLVTTGALVDARDHRGNTPLHIACREGYADIALKLLFPIQQQEIQGNMAPLPPQTIPQNLEARNYDGKMKEKIIIFKHPFYNYM